jgi:hypothetical protein
MAWWLWLLTGLAAGGAVVVAISYIIVTLEQRGSARRRTVRALQSESEQHVQRIMDTVQAMFAAARWPR